jgi:hypothetical protein
MKFPASWCLVCSIHAFMMLSITRHNNNTQIEDNPPPPFSIKIDNKNILSDTLDSAFSSVFRTSLILSQVDSRLEALNLEHLDHDPGHHAQLEQNSLVNYYENLTVGMDIPSTDHEQVADWLTNLKCESFLIPVTKTRQCSDSLLDDILSSYEDSIGSADCDGPILPETPISMVSSSFKVSSRQSSTSSDYGQCNHITVQAIQETAHFHISSHCLSAGRESNKKLDEINDSRSAASASSEMKRSRMSLKGRVRSLSIMSSRRSKSSIETASTVATSPSFDGQNDYNTVTERRESSNAASTKETFMQRLALQHSNKSTATREHSKCIDTGRISTQDIPTLRLPIPYSLPKQCEIERHGAIHYQRDDKGIKEMHKVYTTSDHELHRYSEDAQPETATEDKANLTYNFEAVTPQSLLSTSWSASNVFEYYFDTNETSRYDSCQEIRYELSQTHTNKVVRTITRRNTWNHDRSNTIKENLPLQSNFHNIRSAKTDDDTYPTEIVSSYFRFDGLTF